MIQVSTFDKVEVGMDVATEGSEDTFGTVEAIQYGEGGSDVETPGIKTILETISKALTTNTEYPDEVYERLYNEGFIRIDRGLKSDVFAFSSQVTSVDDETVYLDSSEDDLLEE